MQAQLLPSHSNPLPMKIVVVEDEKDIRESLKELLEAEGYHVLEASNGKEGFEVIMAEQPDLVLCDVNMPEMNGFELLDTLNQNLSDENKPFPSFMFLTALTEVEDFSAGLSLGAEDYITKPFEIEDLFARIRKRLDRRDQLIKMGSQRLRTDKSKILAKRIALPLQDGLELIEMQAIVFVSAERSYCNFHLSDGRVILVSKPMKEYEDALLNRQFLKVHKSSIVNIDYIERYVKGKGGYLILKNGQHVNVAVRKKEELLSLLNP